MKNSERSLSQIRVELTQTGNHEEALLAYLAWQKNHPEIGHLVQHNIKLLEKKLGIVDRHDENHLVVQWLHELSRFQQQNHQILHGHGEGKSDQWGTVVDVSDLLDNFCAVSIEIVSTIHEQSMGFLAYNEFAYLQLNPDVMAAVQAGHFPDGHHHYQDWGKSQNRQISMGEIVETILLEISNVSDALAVLTQASQDLSEAAASLQKMLVTSVGELEKYCQAGLYVLSHAAPGGAHEFSERIYISLNKDIRMFAKSIPTFDPSSHFSSYGKHEQRLHCLQQAIFAIGEKVGHLNLWLKSASASANLHAKSTNDLSRPIFLDRDPGRGKLYNIDFTHFSLAVHIHVYYLDLLEELLERLRFIPFPFDLLLTYCEDLIASSSLAEILTRHEWLTSQYDMIPVQNRGRDLGPLATILADRLCDYKYILHIHTKKSEHTQKLNMWRSQILESLLYSSDSVRNIISLLQQSTDLVIPPQQKYYIKDPSGWADNKAKALAIMASANYPLPTDSHHVLFPEGGMFWMSGRLMKRIAALNMTIEAFEIEPIAQDGSTAHAVERLIGLLAVEEGKTIGQVFLGEADDCNKYYEDHRDFGDELMRLAPCDQVRVLALFLPQFHETFENNAWHGEGFTDWTNVRQTNPLFSHHYQQRFPHPDIGYYDVEDTDYLKTTAALMKASGIDGLIFYHYWFNGTTILSEPAKLLLDHPEIPLPWCFCWANENWTRAWDGNEDQILMHQEYSSADAVAFMEYLIPFFRDDRYLKVNDRPLLIVYRPSHNPMMSEYVELWNQTCAEAGLPSPYLLCTLTRGAVNPDDYGFDAGLERVLHDWTAGNVPEINDQLTFHNRFNGSVLDYNSVADYYIGYPPPSDFKFIRSIVPSWDNTPRYGENAYLLHDSSPRKFSAWLRALILDTRARLAGDERIVVVNAWNEWAESAYLEPDCRTGYAYLNSVARSKLGHAYDMRIENLEACLPRRPEGLMCSLEIPPHVLGHLACDPSVRVKFWSCLTNAYRDKLSISQEILAHIPPELREAFIPLSSLPTSESGQVVNVCFRRIEYLSPGALDSLVRMALAYPTQLIAANSIQFFDHPIQCCNEYAIDLEDCYSNLGILATTAQSFAGHTRVKLCPLAVSMPSSYLFLESEPSLEPPEIVNTIIRIHAKANFRLLQKALFSLFVMEAEVEVQPILACQDFHDPALVAELQQVIDSIPWSNNNTPKILYFSSSDDEPDCRARMLVQPLKQLTARYFAYLDYDDYLYPFAYSYLLGRMRSTTKAIAFGRVYVAWADFGRQVIEEKKRVFEYGYSYEQFVRLNHAPLHSFLLDASQLNLEELEFIPGMRYMEDYYLTLQLFRRDNCDWESLLISKYIGDYTHQVDLSSGLGTLSHLSDEERAELLTQDDFMACELAIQRMRDRLVPSRVGRM